MLTVEPGHAYVHQAFEIYSDWIWRWGVVAIDVYIDDCYIPLAIGSDNLLAAHAWINSNSPSSARPYVHGGSYPWAGGDNSTWLVDAGKCTAAPTAAPVCFELTVSTCTSGSARATQGTAFAAVKQGNLWTSPQVRELPLATNRAVQANCRTHRPQKLKCLISLCTV